MHLKSIELQGFKSFPERTVIEFHTGMTAIVGPNGSGKSNVTDAIRWVLGEQSVKTLRGNKMEDIIFAGTQSRRPLSYAEVQINFDNTDSSIDLPYNEVSVTRRLYRSGESEYRINKNLCRLRDVIELFMDTGIGRDGYSIIGQGRVDELLSNRSEDRRRVFEEAAGITKLRAQKEETSKRLAKTEENLARVTDIVTELDRQLDPLRKQAAAAQAYLELQGEIKRCELTLAQRQLRQCTDQLDILQKDQANAWAELKEIEADLAEQSVADAAQADLAQVFEQRQISLEEQQKVWQNDQLALVSRRTAGQERMTALRERLELCRTEAAALEKTLSELSVERTEQLTGKEEAANGLAEIRKKLESLQDKLSDSENIVAVINRRQQDLRQQAGHLQEEFYACKTLAADANAELKAFEALRERRQNEQDDLNKQLNQLTADGDGAKERVAQATINVEATVAKEKEAAVDLAEAKETLAKTETAWQDLINREQQATFRLKTLSELEKNYDGYQTSVQSLLSPRGIAPDQRRGIYGAVAELITVPAHLEIAIETALGGALQNIVVAQENDAASLINYLKTHHMGRATFLPLDALQAKTSDQEMLRRACDVRGCLGVAADLVTTDGKLDLLKQYLLANVLVAEDMDVGRYIAKMCRHRVRIVTLEGELFSPGGSLTGGSLQQKRPHLLGRTRELKDLQSELANYPRQKEALQKDLKEYKSEMINSGQNLANAQQERQDAEKEYILATAGSEEIEKQLRNSRAKLAEIEAESAAQSEREAKLAGVRQENLVAAEQKQKELGALQNDLAAEEEKYQAATTDQSEKRQLKQQLKMEEQRLNEIVRQADAWLARLQNQENEREMAKQKLREETDQIAGEMAELEKRAAGLENEAAELEQRQTDLQAAAEKLMEERKEYEAAKTAWQEERRILRERQNNIRLSAERLSSKVERIEEQRDTLLNNVWETYNVTLLQVKAEDLADDSVATSNLQKSLSQAKEKVRGLGPVNPCAIEELAAVQERYDFLTAQHEDIVRASKSLIGVMNDLQAAMQERFTAGFAQINTNFNQVFNALFGGGKAEVVMEDPTDVLSGTIEIKAQPPGKRLQNMLLLSGGERALTAIALLFAILNLRAAPFVVLDEIEAALDDANVVRFSDYVRQHADKSQFILVTHRKGTMEACDRIYGVTMQERGVSRVLSMQLSEAATADLAE